MGRVVSLALVRQGLANGHELSQVVAAATIALAAQEEELDKESQAARVFREIQADHAIRAAAWLVWKHRHKLRGADLKRGGIEFTCPRDTALPAWFREAVNLLDARPGWQVTTYVTAGGRKAKRVYRIVWFGRARHNAKKSR